MNRKDRRLKQPPKGKKLVIKDEVFLNCFFIFLGLVFIAFMAWVIYSVVVEDVDYNKEWAFEVYYSDITIGENMAIDHDNATWNIMFLNDASGNLTPILNVCAFDTSGKYEWENGYLHCTAHDIYITQDDAVRSLGTCYPIVISPAYYGTRGDGVIFYLEMIEALADYAEAYDPNTLAKLDLADIDYTGEFTVERYGQSYTFIIRPNNEENSCWVGLNQCIQGGESGFLLDETEKFLVCQDHGGAIPVDQLYVQQDGCGIVQITHGYWFYDGVLTIYSSALEEG